jgi:hypothetical protein
MPKELIKFWRKCDLAPPFVNPEDLPVLKQKANRLIDAAPLNFDSFVLSGRFGKFDGNLDFSLYPIPYVGDLRKAKIVILMLNPGLRFDTYWAESRMPEFRKRLEANLRQDFHGIDFPFFCLDPELCWYGGFVWWESKLRDVISLVAKKHFRGSYLRALRDLSKKLACVELIPYHSSSFKDHVLIGQLPSAKMALRMVTKDLVPDAEAGRRTIIVTRQIRSWGFDPRATHSANVVLYEGGHTRGASLGPNSRDGKAILKRYGIDLAPAKRIP